MLHKLDGNVGLVIKIVVEIFLVLNCIVTALACFYCLLKGWFIRILWLVLELLGAWIVAMLLYGFGAIVQNTEKIVEKIEKDDEAHKNELNLVKVKNEKIKDSQKKLTRWQNEILSLSDEELAKRLQNEEDWQIEYIDLCRAELELRQKSK